MILKADEWIELDGYPVAVFRGFVGLDPRTLQGDLVVIDDHPYRVRRVGTSAVMDPTGLDFTLQLEPVAPIASAQGDGAGE